VKSIYLEETKITPRVEFDTSGELNIRGRSLPRDPGGFYGPLLHWAKDCEAETINFTIRLEYMNTSSAKYLYNLLCILRDNIHVKLFSVNWYYEEGDEDVYDAGCEFEVMSNLSFKFFEYEEIH
jgi:hypothetical protein